MARTAKRTTTRAGGARKPVPGKSPGKSKDREYVLRMAKENNVKFIRFWFTDILGSLKNFAITHDELELSIYEGQGFDGSSIQGFARIDESDMVAMPDPSTFQLLPWRSGPQGHVARMFCDILNPDGTPYEGDPRYVLKQNLKEAANLGYTFYIGPELEFFLFKDSEGTEILDRGGYFDMTILDAASNYRRDAVQTLQAMGIDVEYSHHEVGPSQHEIDLRYTDALTMADNTMTYRLVVKETAMAHGMYATFMPKPLFGENGSGMHTHQSLFKGSKNAFFNPKDKHYLSDVAKGYIAGLLRHIPEINITLNQWVNSYKRLVPGYEAPVYLTWAIRNRSDLVRVPVYKPGKEQATRVELRSPDPACNPYLAFSAMLAAGLAGIKGKYKLAEPVERNVYEMTVEEREALGIGQLPSDLNEAIKAAEESKLLRKCLGDHVFTKLLENKRMEWDEYRAHVSQFELDKYLPIL